MAMKFKQELKTTKVNGNNRIYLEKDLRDKLNIKEGDELSIETDHQNRAILLKVVD